MGALWCPRPNHDGRMVPEIEAVRRDAVLDRRTKSNAHFFGWLSSEDAVLVLQPRLLDGLALLKLQSVGTNPQ